MKPHVYCILSVCVLCTRALTVSAAELRVGELSASAEAVAIGGSRLIPHVSVRPQQQANRRNVDLLLEVDGELWIADPFFHADWPCYAMAVLWCGDEPKAPVFLPRRSSDSLDPSRGGLVLSSGMFVGSRFVAEVANTHPDKDVSEEEWFVQLLVLDGVASGMADGARRIPEWHVVGRSARALLGVFPTSSRISLVRRPMREAVAAGEFPVESLLQYSGSVKSASERDSVEVLFVNRGAASLSLFNPFLQHLALTSFPGRLCVETQADAEAVKDILKPAAYVSYVRPHRAMAFELPISGICGARVELPPEPIGTVATLRLELDGRFVCNDRPLDAGGYFVDVPFGPMRTGDIEVQQTTSIHYKAGE